MRENKSQNLQINRVMIAGTHSGVGKTTITLGVMAMLKKKGYEVQAFKSGPDYIDTGHHSEATGRKSRNLDTWMMDDDACKEIFHRTASKSQISVIEGVMGLYDGSLDEELRGSSAYLAVLLNTPVILVIDVKGMAQSAGAIALGFKQYGVNVDLRGVILNRVGSKRHFNAVKQAIESTSGLPVLGYLAKNSEFTIPERHLGLVPSVEYNDTSLLYNELANQMEPTLNVDLVLDVSKNAGEFPPFRKNIFTKDYIQPIQDSHAVVGCKSYDCGREKPVRIAVAMDEAFHFYYQDNLELLSDLGAELIHFSLIHDTKLPEDIDGIYIGGGFPELFGETLEVNEAMRSAVKQASEDGTVIYAECGGMMYLLDKLIDCDGKSYKMSGVFSASSKMQKRRQGLGYILVNAIEDNIICRKGDFFKAHEFHWSSIVEPENVEDLSFAYKINKKDNSAIKFDGFFKKNVLASYAHIHFASKPALAVNLLMTMGFGA